MSATERLDTLGIWDAMLALPEQIEASMATIDSIPDLPNADSIEHVLILGMGDSGFGGDVAAASARPFSSKPIVVYGGYLPPSWVGSNTLVIAMSASGSTEETLESLEAAVDSGASLVAITNGGELKSLAERAGHQRCSPSSRPGSSPGLVRGSAKRSISSSRGAKRLMPPTANRRSWLVESAAPCH